MPNPKHTIKVYGFIHDTPVYRTQRLLPYLDEESAYVTAELTHDFMFTYTLSNKYMGLLKSRQGNILKGISGFIFKHFRKKIAPEHWGNAYLRMAIAHDEKIYYEYVHRGLESVELQHADDNTQRNGYNQTYFRNIHSISKELAVVFLTYGLHYLELLKDSNPQSRSKDDNQLTYNNYGGIGFVSQYPLDKPNDNTSVLMTRISYSTVTLKRYKGSILERAITNLIESGRPGDISVTIKEFTSPKVRQEYLTHVHTLITHSLTYADAKYRSYSNPSQSSNFFASWGSYAGGLDF